MTQLTTATFAPGVRRRILRLLRAVSAPMNGNRNVGEVKNSQIRVALQQPEAFDTAYYLSKYLDVAEANVDALDHYIEYGWREGRSPNKWFSSSLYLKMYPDVKNADLEPLYHYLMFGKAEGRLAYVDHLDGASSEDQTAYEFLRDSGEFDAQFYLIKNADIASLGIDPLLHYVRYGVVEGRNPNAWFSSSEYLSLHADVAKARLNPFYHYLRYGRAEKRALRHSGADDLPITFRFQKYDVCNGIFVVTHDFSETGAPMAALNLVETINQQFGIPIYVVSPAGEGPLLEAFKAAAREIIPFGQMLISAEGDVSKACSQLALYLKANGVNHGICNTIVMGTIACRLAAEGLEICSLLHEMPHSVKSYGWQNHADEIVMGSHTVVFACATVRDAFENSFGSLGDRSRLSSQPSNTHTISDDDEWITHREVLRAGLGLPQDCFLVMGCGYGDFRKGIDLFTNIAKLCAHIDSPKICFMWVGDIQPQFKVWLDKDLSMGLLDTLVCPGQVGNLAPYFAASDLFLLSSREDPFPTVVIEALNAGIPVIGFEGSGGVVEQVTPESGVIVPYSDCAAAASTIFEIATSRRRIGQDAVKEQGRKLNVGAHYARDLISLLQFRQTVSERQATRDRIIASDVAIAVPTYNCLDYVEDRIWSAFEQTAMPARVYITDDRSPDGTYLAIRRLSALSVAPVEIEQNEKNSGSPFPQWKKCFQHCTEKYVWLAESDDYCELTFLDQVAPLLRGDVDGKGVVLAYSNSAVMRPDSSVQPEGHDGYLNAVARLDRWSKDYRHSGIREISEVLYIANTIPNASACIFDRQAALQSIDSALPFQAVGDWIFYLCLLRHGAIAYKSARLNYHRRHGQSVITRLESSPVFHAERNAIGSFIANNFDIGESKLAHIKRKNYEEFQRLVVARNDGRPSSYIEALQSSFESVARRDPTSKNILIILPEFHVGGGQIVGIRFANALANKHNVWIYVVNHNQGTGDTRSRISDRVGLLPKMTYDELIRFIRLARIELINSHIWWSDKLAYSLKKNFPEVKWLITMHGCYEKILENPSIDKEFSGLSKSMLKSSDGIIILTDKHKRAIEQIGLIEPEVKTCKVYNGYQPESAVGRSKQTSGRDELRQHVRFVMVARGIPDKGWREAANALRRANAKLNAMSEPEIVLRFVGDGPCLQELRGSDEFKGSSIEFVGNVDNVSEYLMDSDVGILPSYFTSESLPNSVVEYLFADLAVIVTDIGECAEMLVAGDERAGTVIGFDSSGVADVEELSEAFIRYATDKSHLSKHKRLAQIARQKFEMRNMIERYGELVGLKL